MTMRFVSLALFVTLLLALTACQRQGNDTTSPTSPTTTTTSPPATTNNTIGVPECDEYLRKYQACVSTHVPEADRARLQQTLDQTRAAWRTTYGTPNGRESLVNTCKQMIETAKTSMATYGCTDF